MLLTTLAREPKAGLLSAPKQSLNASDQSSDHSLWITGKGRDRERSVRDGHNPLFLIKTFHFLWARWIRNASSLGCYLSLFSSISILIHHPKGRNRRSHIAAPWFIFHLEIIPEFQFPIESVCLIPGNWNVGTSLGRKISHAAFTPSKPSWMRAERKFEGNVDS